MSRFSGVWKPQGIYRRINLINYKKKATERMKAMAKKLKLKKKK